MPHWIYYTGGSVDRVDDRRRDRDWIARKLRDDTTRVLPVWHDRNLMRADGAPCPVALTGPLARDALAMAEEVALLGLDGSVAVFAVDVPGEDQPAFNGSPGPAEFLDLRQTAPTLPRDEGALLAYARGILYWHRRHRFCGDCGSPTESRQGGHVRKCTDPGCGRSHFPRTDPAVIMLVTREGPQGEAALLAHKHGFLPGMYSTLAGFVEPGESLEEAVAREVWEEAGVRVTDVRYRASQPWPFPSSLMLGFRARAVTSEITFNPDELADAAWFTPDDIARMPEAGKRLPRPDSIALWLIREWLAEGGNWP